MISVLLLYKILQLAVYMMLGFMLVKLKIVKSKDSSVLSKISLYLLMPAAIVNSFDVEITPHIMQGLTLAFAVAISIHILFLILDIVYKKVFNGTGVERASVMYPNAANLIIPIVSYVLGDEWVIYSCAFMSVQIAFIWTHGIQLFSKTKINIKKILLNINIIAIAIGALIMLAGFRLPVFVKDVIYPLSNMLGIVGMVIAGMLAAEVKFKKMLANKRLYLVLIIRLIVYPIIVLVALKCVQMGINVANEDKILLITYLASITPSAATVVQLAQVNNSNEDYAVSINIGATVLCIATMPIFVALYQMW